MQSYWTGECIRSARHGELSIRVAHCQFQLRPLGVSASHWTSELRASCSAESSPTDLEGAAQQSKDGLQASDCLPCVFLGIRPSGQLTRSHESANACLESGSTRPAWGLKVESAVLFGWGSAFARRAVADRRSGLTRSRQGGARTVEGDLRS